MAKRPETPPPPPPATRQERILVFMFAAVLGLSVIAIIALFVAGVNATGEFWAIIQVLPLIGLPLAMVLLITLIVLNAVRRSRAAKVAGK